MKRSVRLALKKETLADLSGDDLGGIAGGAPSSPTCNTCLDCILVWGTLPDTECVPEITFRTICR